MTIRALSLACLILAAMVVTAFAQKDKEKPKAPQYKSPQEVFDASQKAQAKEDYLTYLRCFTPRFHAEMILDGGLGRLVQRRAEWLAKNDEKSRAELKKVKPILDVLDKHGLTVKAIEKMIEDTQDKEKRRKALLALIKDHAAFIFDVGTVANKFKGSGPPGDENLTDVKIDGDRATGTVVSVRIVKQKDKQDEKVEAKRTMTFEKVNGGWLIDERDAPKKK